MCQLTLISTSIPYITRNLFYSLLVANSMQNRDGTGFYDPIANTYWKTEKAADTIEVELAKQLSVFNNETIIGHVRSASLTGAVKIVTKEKAHPFISENFILFHNGGLERKERAWNKADEGLIDSEVFLMQLQSNYRKEHNIVKLLQNTMEQFCGKFAFMIIHNSNIYVIRGKSAELYQCNITSGGERVGMVVNTGNISGEKGLLKGCAYTLLNNVPVDFSKLEELEKESIFLFRPQSKDLEKIGELKENDKPYSYAVNNSNYSNWTAVTATEKAAKRIYEYMVELGLTLEEMNNLIDKSIGVGILQLTPKDYNLLFLILEEFKKRKDGNAKSYALWHDIRNHSGILGIEIYDKLDIQFPYFLDQNLPAILARVKQENKDKRNLLIV